MADFGWDGERNAFEAERKGVVKSVGVLLSKRC